MLVTSSHMVNYNNHLDSVDLMLLQEMEMASNTSSPESMKTSNSQLAAYSQVCFRNVPETFAIGSDIECSYVMREELQASPSDWIGLYKVGWRLPKDYVYYKWSQIPASYVPGKEAFSHVTFPG